MFNTVYQLAKTTEFILGLSLVVALLFGFFLYLNSRMSKKVVEINPETEPNLWSFYKDSGWSIVQDDDSWNKVLKIKNSAYPAILKFGSEWINYVFSFQVKVPSSVEESHQNFSFVVRAKDKANSIFLQCRPGGKIRPHFIADGLFIVDSENEIDFPAEYPLDKWVSVTVTVEGDLITVSMMGVSTEYKIPSKRVTISGGLAKTVMTLKYVLEKELNPSVDWTRTNLSSGVFVLNLDYEKGTVGFRESDKEEALFRKIKVELRQP